MSLSTTSPTETDDPLAGPALEAAMAWYGWGSPVGLAIALVGVGITSVLARVALVGL